MTAKRPPGEHEKLVAFGWLIFGVMFLYILVTILTRACAVETGLIPHF